MKKFWVALMCVIALLYFDAKDREVSYGRNHHKFHTDSDLVIRTRNISVRSICFMAIKRKQTRVKCPVCDKWVSTLVTRQRSDGSVYRRYECANEHRFVTKEKVERVLVLSSTKRRSYATKQKKTN